MIHRVQQLMDTKQIVGVAGTAGSLWAQHIDIIEPVVGVFFTIAVGSLTIWYTWERAIKLRRERLEGRKEKDDE